MLVSTIIEETDKGYTKPLTSDANKKHYQEEYLRMVGLEM